MVVFFEVIKGIFFFLTIVVGLIFLRGDVMMGANSLLITKQILMPGYLLFCGMMLGYIISRVWIGYDEEREDVLHIYSTSLLIGTGIGLFLAIIYLFV